MPSLPVSVINASAYQCLVAYKSYKISYILKILHRLLYINFWLWGCDNGNLFVQKCEKSGSPVRVWAESQIGFVMGLELVVSLCNSSILATTGHLWQADALISDNPLLLGQIETYMEAPTINPTISSNSTYQQQDTNNR